MKHDAMDKELRRRVIAEREAFRGRRVRFSNELRDAVLARAATTDGTLEALCDAVALSASTLARWRRNSGSLTKKSPVSTAASTERKKARLKRVGLAPESNAVTTLTLRFPSGAELQGLTPEQLRELLGVRQ